MHIHILGICGTFMGGLALIARSLGHKVTGSDQNVYPPMSVQLEEQGIELMQGYEVSHLDSKPDLIIIGNALSRGNAVVEYILNNKLAYTSGPDWLSSAVLNKKHVFAVSGTHGKTTTTTMLSWILEANELNPSFLIGGVAENFGISARLTNSEYFVIEADEYDTAFFDKRSKFVHYHPNTLIINNLEFDHADIFSDLNAIKTQFHYVVRLVPEKGQVIYPDNDNNVLSVLEKGSWSEQIALNQQHGWKIKKRSEDYSEFSVQFNDETHATVSWQLMGEFNAMNALAAIIAAHQVGVSIQQAAESLTEFKSVKRRLECIGNINNIRIYDDFAHHPTAIKATVKALRANIGSKRLLAILEPRSNTMKLGVHKAELVEALNDADQVFVYSSDQVQWDVNEVLMELDEKLYIETNTDSLLEKLLANTQAGDHILIMSNGGFENFHQRLLKSLETKN